MTQETRSIPSEKNQSSQPEKPARNDSRIIGRILLIFLLFLILRLCVEWLLAIVIMGIVHSVPESTKEALVILKDGEFVNFTGNTTVIISGISFAVCGAVIFGRALGFAKKYTLKKITSPAYAALSCLSAAFLVISLNIIIARSGIAELSEGYRQTAAMQYSCAFPIGIIVYGLVTPLSEELLFRGIIFNGIKSYLSWKPAMILTSVLFAVYHGNGVQGIYALIMSLFFIYLYEKSGNLLVPILMHSVSNITAYILTYVYGNISSLTSDILMIAGGILWAACFALLLSYDRIIKKKND